MIRLAVVWILLSAAPAAADTIRVLAAGVKAPFGIDFAPDGGIYVVEMAGGERLRHIDKAGVVTTLAGTGAKGHAGDGGPGPKATFNGMHGLAVGPAGVVYLADTWNNCIRTFDPKTGTVARFAGTGVKGFAGDGGKALDAQFGGTYCIAFDSERTTMYVADLDNRRVRWIEMKTGIVRTAAGNGKRGIPADGQSALSQPLIDPRAVAVAERGFFVLERGGHALRSVSIKGTMATIAGTGAAGLGTPTGKPLEVTFNGPKFVTATPRGVLICDTENHRILRLTDGRIEHVAGTGKKGKAVTGDPKTTELFQPHGVAEHPTTGDIYIADSGNDRVLVIGK